jgi:hypothetical protein
MNVQNITALSKKLDELGFSDLTYPLVKRICFRPDNFWINHKIVKEDGQIEVKLFFEYSAKDELYYLLYYDGVFKKELSIAETFVNGINPLDLDKLMFAIDWVKAFDLDEKKELNINDKISLEKEQKIEDIMTLLTSLEDSYEGKAIAAILKQRHWSGTAHHELFRNISGLKTKGEVSQRFFLFNGQQGISADDAYRFLQNKWLEKQILAKSKLPDESDVGENDSNASSGNGLLKKKRISRPKGAKRNKAIQN